MDNNNSQKHGGARSGAGRPKGSGKYKEPTKAIRVPESSIAHIKNFLVNYHDSAASQAEKQTNDIHKLAIPFFSSTVAAGYPSPAEDHIEENYDLNDYMVKRPDSTFMLRVEGESMKNIGIMPDDILLVDRSLMATNNTIVVASVDGELTVKRLYRRDGIIKLLPENTAYPDIIIESESALIRCGVVTGSLRRFQTF